MEIKGKLIEIFEEQKITDSFKKRDCVIEYADNPEYPEFVKVEFIQDKCDLLNSYQVGQEVTIRINLGGRKWVNPQGETKYFNSVKGWKIEGESKPDQELIKTPEQDAFPSEEEDTHLPF